MAGRGGLADQIPPADAAAFLQEMLDDVRPTPTPVLARGGLAAS